MNATPSLRQAQVISIFVAALLAGSAYVMHPMLNYTVIPAPEITAGATLTLVLVAFAFRHAAFRMFSGQFLIGQGQPENRDVDQAAMRLSAPPGIEREFHQLRQFLEILCRQLQNSAETGDKAAIHLATDLLEIDKALFRSGRDTSALPASTSGQVSEQLADALTRIQYQDTVNQQITNVIQALERLDAYTGQVAIGIMHPDSDAIRSLKPVSALLDELYDSYISEQQRSIHNALLKRSVPSFSDSRTELY